jgi:hypothetical protein
MLPATIPATATITSTGNTAGHYNGTESPASGEEERKRPNYQLLQSLKLL